MALTYTPKGELGSKLPKFQLPSLQSKNFSSEQILQSPAKLVMFICAHCPYVLAIEDRLIELGKELKKLGVPVVAICSNDATDYPEDSPAALLKRYNEKSYDFTYLIDEDQSVAKAFDAVCTPDFFVYDQDNCLTYRGRLDDSWKDAGKVQNQELLFAVHKILKGERPAEEQIPSMGCSIKWKA